MSVEEGVVLFREGEPADSWWLLLDGAINLLRHVGREDVVVGRMDAPGRWAGGFRAWDEQGVYLATGRGASVGRVLQVRADVLRECSKAWFPFGAHLIEGLYHTARSIESTARQRDSLVTLGTLAAGLAHELNNPAAAATRAADALKSTCDSLLSTLTSLAENQISATQFTRTRRATPARSSHPPGLQTRSNWRTPRTHCLPGWKGTASAATGSSRQPLAAAGVDVTWCDRVAAQLPEQALEPALEWVASTLSAATLLSEVKASTRRISELVGSVKSYSHLDRASLQDLDVTDGTREHAGHARPQAPRRHQCRSRLRRERVPRIVGYPGELNQVWTNLIDNAADAMPGRWHAAPDAPASTRATSSSRSLTPATGCRRRLRREHSNPSIRRRTSAKAPGSGSISLGASSKSGTAARSRSTRNRATPCCAFACRWRHQVIDSQ